MKLETLRLTMCCATAMASSLAAHAAFAQIGGAPGGSVNPATPAAGTANGASTVAGATSSPAATPPGNAATPPGASGATLGEVVVTARRVQENLQSVPVSITAFSPNTLRQDNIASAEDLTQVTPGAFLASSGARENSEFSIRGQSKPVAGASPSNAGVVTYFNDVPLTNYLSSLPQFDVSSIQVLKGPQGTLFGRNTTGGAVLQYSAPPTANYGGYVQGSYGNYNTREVEGAVNLPIIADKVELRIAGRVDRADGDVKQLGVGGDLNNQHDESYRASLLLHPVSWLTNTTVFDTAYAPLASHTPSAQIIVQSSLAPVIPAVASAIAAQKANGPFATNSDIGEHSGWRSTGVSNKTVIDLPENMSFTNIFGFRKVAYTSITNFDGLPGDYYNDLQTEHLKQYTEEVQLHGKMFGGRFNWLLGAFTLDSTPDGAFGGLGTTQDLFAGFTGLPAAFFANTPFGYGFYSERSTAGFLNFSYDLSDFVKGLKFNGGYRYTFDRYSACSGSQPGVVQPDGYESLDPSNYPLTKGQCNATNLEGYSRQFGHSSAPTWTVGMDYQATRDLFFYVTARRGYRSGGLNTPALGPNFVAAGLQNYAPEKITDEEVGVKSDFRYNDMRARLDVSVFHSETTQLQLIGTQIQTAAPYCTQNGGTSPVYIDGDCNPLNDPTQTVLTANGGTEDIVGFEGNLTLLPFQGLIIDVGGSALSNSDSINVPAIVAPYFPGGQLLFTPKVTSTLDVHYTLPLAPDIGEFVFTPQLYYSSSVYLGGISAKAYNVTNMRLDWNGILRSKVDLSFYVKNLFDREYVNGPAFTGPTSFVETVQFGDPRTYGVQLRYRFGVS